MKEGVSGQVVANEKFSAAATIAAHHLHCDRDYDSSLVLRLDVNVHVFSHPLPSFPLSFSLHLFAGEQKPKTFHAAVVVACFETAKAKKIEGKESADDERSM